MLKIAIARVLRCCVRQRGGEMEGTCLSDLMITWLLLAVVDMQTEELRTYGQFRSIMRVLP